jgi:hypothetical protein
MTAWLYVAVFVVCIGAAIAICEWLDRRETWRIMREAFEWNDDDQALLDAHVRIYGGVYDHERGGDFDA